MSWPYELTDKLIVLGGLISDTLIVHDANWVVVTRPRAEYVLFRSRNRNDRTRIMGDPVRYCEVLYQQPVSSGDDMVMADGSQVYVTHRFSVDVFYEYADADTQGASSEDAWVDAMESIVSGSEGLLTKLRLTEKIVYGDAPATSGGLTRVTETGVTRVTEGGVTRVTEGGSTVPTSFIANLGVPSPAPLNTIIPLSGDGKERAHVTSFTIDVT